MEIVVFLNNLMHDFAAAGWFFGAMMLVLIRRRSASSGLGVEGAMFVVRTIRALMWGCLCGILVCGTVRALAYRQYEWNAAAGDAQVRILVIKHIVFFVLFFASLWEFVRAGREAAEKKNHAG